VKALLRTADELRKAQEQGESGSDFREKVDAERQAVRSLSQSAGELLAGEGRARTDATLDRVAKTLHAAVGDEEARRLLEAGRLSKELDPPGFDALAGMTLPAKPRAGRAASSREDAARRRRLRERAQKARAEARKRAKVAEDAEQKAVDAREAADRLRAEADEAERAAAEAEAEARRSD
jgi:hypothetical protein